MPIIETTVPGLTCIPGYLTPNEQVELLDSIDRAPWSVELKRRVQHYGYRYDYRRKTVDRDMRLGPLPEWGAELAQRLLRDGHVPRVLNQLIVNEYLPGQGIAAHIDCVPCFADRVLSLSLGSSCILTMRHAETAADVPMLLDPGSLLVLAGEARYEWTHRIAARKRDVVAGQTIERGRRVSLTYRTVLRSR
jgi:alkylated DNA repair dioxygenase AlkB